MFSALKNHTQAQTVAEKKSSRKRDRRRRKKKAKSVNF
jgi:hypothetical protein